MWTLTVNTGAAMDSLRVQPATMRLRNRMIFIRAPWHSVISKDFYLTTQPKHFMKPSKIFIIQSIVLTSLKKRLNVCQRAKDVQPEIQFVLDREADAHILCDMLEKGELPLRVTHNDTKLNNIMIDDKTGKGICVIDLDTVMPGLALNDFGDSIRFGASTGAEDEQDLSKISCDMNLFALYTKGYVEGCAGSLTEMEIKMLPTGAKLMTFECGMRFLTDYLQGDTYFKIHRDKQNVDRCRTQFKLVADMEEKWDEMAEIVEKYL